ncbi:lipoprotein [Lederbergia citri]|uniref:Membrane lipoprotein lipid attachment site-containing protein n=1 Tax=Lederbergia citri TaxID=2833580 RepID=A0A942TCW1_9BACI|nr:membrane lipoprotein lipid attachment site-containing protein [Lederbergia citri]MBS4194154.1 membrane lipoprotein lipid attachment site-containing protein [Lederbergia citri]
MKKLLSLLVTIALLSGCSSKLSFSEVGENSVNKDIQSFINDVNDENGVHLFFENQKAVYVYLNGSNVKQGEKAIHFTDFNVEKNDKTLSICILYNTAKTADYSNQSLKHELIYKVNLDKKYEVIKSFSNGEEASFGIISGNQ